MNNRPRIYLDNCCFNRPFDDQSHLTVHLETRAKLMIQDLIKDERLELIWSFILDYENQANPNELVKSEIHEWRGLACSVIRLSEPLMATAKELQRLGLHHKDALHLASAIEGHANRFITVDKGILKKSNAVQRVAVCDPIKYIAELEDQ